ncbi:F-box domain containing protein [Melia azedarach]|uniref:F-box domain containing protein n=1 Tax=Melia azedarach TaxID=155640 RepID=A0ACC1WZJ0_MELAZ|nr:F-box domain containing protein [Melia azedarach]
MKRKTKMENQQNYRLGFPIYNIFQILARYKEQDLYGLLRENPRCGKFCVAESKKKVKNSQKNNDYVKEDFMTGLSDEILYLILLKSSAKDLEDNIRFVCRRWHKLISCSDFITRHTLENKYSQVLIVTPVLEPYRNSQVRELEMDVKDIDFTLNIIPTPKMARQILSSFNGLTLVHGRRDRRLLHVVNLITKSSETLPACPSRCLHLACGTAITFDPATSVYRVVHMYADGFGMEMFTLGCSDNAWKKIPGPFEVPQERPFNVRTFRWTNLVSINGQFLHWDVGSDAYIISMNISDEKWRRIHLPGYDRYRYDLLDMGGSLALLYKVSNTQIDVWTLEDFEKQDWIKRRSIMAESINYTTKSSIRYTSSLPDLRRLCAVTALEDGRAIMFRHQIDKYDWDWYLYSMKQGELKRFKMKIKSNSKFIHHRSSLVCWRNEKDPQSVKSPEKYMQEGALPEEDLEAEKLPEKDQDAEELPEQDQQAEKLPEKDLEAEKLTEKDLEAERSPDLFADWVFV